MTTQDHYDILICGGGSAGISIAARLIQTLPDAKIAVVEPSEYHYYQPIWTLVGAGEFPRESSRREQADVIPNNVTWIQDRVAGFLPDKNQIELQKGGALAYGQLIVSMGIELQWSKVRGLEQTLGKNGVSSNYSYDTTHLTWEMIRSFQEGSALFTFPATPIKCAGAPQKIMYLAEETFRQKGIRSRCQVLYMSATPSLFGVPKYRNALQKVVDARGIETHYRENLVEVRPSSKEAVFENLDTQKESVRKYDFLHVTPPQGAPGVIAQSPLASEAGWVDVDDFTLQHRRFSNVWSAGDCSSLPVSKTGAAVRKQVPVLVDNLVASLQGKAPLARYDGYASCPLVTGRGKVILAEFGYGGKIMESFPFDQAKERYSMYALKAYALPDLYWHGMLQGRL